MSIAERINSIRSMDAEDVSRAYARQMSRFQAGYDKTARTIHAMAPDSKRILDAATGPALAIPEIARLFPEASIQALDQSSHMLARADETLASSGIRERVELVQGSVYDMPFDDGAFDLVIASQLIHMLDELPAFLNETRRVLGLGGALVIFDFRRDVPRWYRVVAEMSTAVLHAFRVPMDGMGPVIRASYTPKELEAALRDAGFDDVRIDTRLAQVTAHAR